MNIKVLCFEKVEDRGKIAGLASIEMDGMIYRDVKMVSGMNGLFYAFPSHTRQNEMGDKEYYDIVEFVDSSRKIEFREAMKTAITEFQKGKESEDVPRQEDPNSRMDSLADGNLDGLPF